MLYSFKFNDMHYPSLISLNSLYENKIYFQIPLIIYFYCLCYIYIIIHYAPTFQKKASITLHVKVIYFLFIYFSNQVIFLSISINYFLFLLNDYNLFIFNIHSLCFKNHNVYVHVLHLNYYLQVLSSTYQLSFF